MLSKVEWGEYKIIDVFNVKNTQCILSRDVSPEVNGTPYLCAGSENNAVSAYIKYDTRYLDNGNCIFIGGKTLVVTYQKEDFYSNDSHNLALYLKNIFKASRATYLFLASCVYQGLKNKYSWGDSISYKKIQSDKIKLPTLNGEIDFDFMERFVAELEAQRVAELEAYLTATGLKNYELTVAEQKALEDFENGSGETWQEFKLIDVFKVKNTQCILSRDVEVKENGTPYLCASADNNAISSYISYNKKYLDKGNCIFIGGKTFVVTYQGDDFYSNDSHNLALYLKDSENATLITQLFCISCIKCGLGYKYSWGDSISFKKIQSDIIQLPVKKGAIDFEFMATFISAIQKLIIKDVVLYSDRKIAATKQCCKK